MRQPGCRTQAANASNAPAWWTETENAGSRAESAAGCPEMTVAANGDHDQTGPRLRQRRSLRATIAVYASGSFLASALGMLGGFLSTRLVDPSTLGALNGFLLVLGYLPLASLGVFQGLNRELPYCFGKGKEEEARSLAATAMAWAILAGGISAFALLAIASWFALQAEWSHAAGWATAAVCAFLLLFETNYLQTVFRCCDSFGRLAKMLVIQAVMNVSLVGAVWLFGFYGLCIRAMGIALISVVLLWCWRPVRFVPHVKLAELKRLVGVGMPILVVTQASLLWAVVNQTLILRFMGTRELVL